MNFFKDIEHCLRVLRNGGIILYPTDTVWGIGCDASNNTAVSRIFQLKGRPDDKSFIILVKDHAMLSNYVENAGAIFYDPTIPTTIIYPKAKNLASKATAADGSVAIRIVQDEFCQNLIAAFGAPIVSTSANFHKSATPRIFDEISEEIKNGVDYVAKHRQYDIEIKEPSRILKLEQDGSFTVIRS